MPLEYMPSTQRPFRQMTAVYTFIVMLHSYYSKIMKAVASLDVYKAGCEIKDVSSNDWYKSDILSKEQMNCSCLATFRQNIAILHSYYVCITLITGSQQIILKYSHDDACINYSLLYIVDISIGHQYQYLHIFRELVGYNALIFICFYVCQMIC